MKKPFLFSFVLCATVIAAAQKTYFVYLQTDNLSPFYVRMADKIYSSSVAGYLILPNLTDSTYTMGVGFPKSTAPETRFAVSVKQADKGYLLKNFSDGLTLFDIEELAVIKSVSAVRDNTLYETKTDKFSAVLSKAADDPSLLKVPVVKKEEPKTEPEKKEEITVKKEEAKPDQKGLVVAKAEEKKPIEEKPIDTAAMKAAETAEAKVEKKEPPKIETATAADTKVKVEERPASSGDNAAVNTTEAVVYKPSTVVRRSESSTTEGFGIVYIDKMEGRTDTVRILIPPSKFNLEVTPQQTTTSEVIKSPEVVNKNSVPAAVKAQGDSVVNEANQKSEQKVTTGSKTASGSPCKELASDKDFMKLRKNMAAKSSEEDMVFEAKKAFKLRCYTSEQVRYLSTLFLTPAGKYGFFDTAYNFVADKDAFAALQSEIKDDYYLKRFKALVGE